MSVEMNLPDVVAEIAAMVAAYDEALQANDVPRVMNFFFNSPETVRYGPSETLYGFDAIARFRAARPATPRPRQVLGTRITAYGPDHGVAHVEYRSASMPGLGRQTQTWVRMADGWKIVSAHVSADASVG